MSLLRVAIPVVTFLLNLRDTYSYYNDWFRNKSQSCYVQFWVDEGIDMRRIHIRGKLLALYYILHDEPNYDWDHLVPKFEKHGIKLEEGMIFETTFETIRVIKYDDLDFGPQMAFTLI